MRLDDLLAEAGNTLAQVGIDQPELDARLLLQYLTGATRSHLLLHGEVPVDAQTAAHYRSIIQQRAQRIPLQYLTGSQEFWSLDFKVSPAVLIPRQETEFLLEEVVRVCASAGVTRALDLCTGSGVIAVVLAKEFNCPVVALDISVAALEIAAFNIARHGLTDRIQLVCSDLLTAVHQNQPFDLLVSNPPYVAEEDIDYLQPEVGQAEPKLALSGGPGGMQYLERIAASAFAYLCPGGRLFVEIGADQAGAVFTLFCSKASHYDQVGIINDWSGRPRVLQARRIP